MRIFLTGMMGSGKTFWGKKIAFVHQHHFIDLDQYIEEDYGESISSIFKKKGEDYFRFIEKKYLLQLIEKYSNAVIALGGGTITDIKNIELMKQYGTLFYLKTDVDILTSRLKNELSQRPLLEYVTEKELGNKLQTILLSREELYNQSDVIIDMNYINELTFAQTFIENYV